MMPLYAELENCDMVAVGERVHYLSLALDARRALNAIRATAKGDDHNSELRESIRAATESLEIISKHGDLYAKVSPEHYVQYEEIQTLREMSSSIDAAPLIQSLRSLLSVEAGGHAPEDLDTARKFFRALESRALHHYNDPGSGDVLTA
jgi:hypothetical protein